MHPGSDPVPGIALASASSEESETRVPWVTEEVGAANPVPRQHPRTVEIIAKTIDEDSRYAYWPEGVDRLGAASLPLSGSAPPRLYGKGAADSFRILRLSIRSGEQLSFAMQAEASSVVMEACVPTDIASLPWRLALLNANSLLPQVRSRRFQVQNPTGEAQVLDLLVYGVHGYAYQIDLTRTARPASGP